MYRVTSPSRGGDDYRQRRSSQCSKLSSTVAPSLPLSSDRSSSSFSSNFKHSSNILKYFSYDNFVNFNDYGSVVPSEIDQKYDSPQSPIKWHGRNEPSSVVSSRSFATLFFSHYVSTPYHCCQCRWFLIQEHHTLPCYADSPNQSPQGRIGDTHTRRSVVLTILISSTVPQLWNVSKYGEGWF